MGSMTRKTANQMLSFAGISALTLLTAVIFILIVGGNVIIAFSSFFRGIWGSAYSISEVFVKATPLIFTGLGVTIGFRSGFVNIGAEGQLYMGAIAATAISLSFKGMPAIIMLPLIFLGGFAAGGLWALIPGTLKAKFGISEVICTIMFNYIAINITGILVRTWLKDPNYPYPISPAMPESAWLPAFFPTLRIHAGILVALAFAAAVYLLVWRTPTGFRMRAVGLNPRACKCVGISVNKNIMLSAVLSGGLAGLAGVCEVAGLHHKLLEGISPDYGYLAIIVALLGGSNPAGVIAAAFGISALQTGSLSMQRGAGVPASISSVIMGVIVLLVLSRKVLFKHLLMKEQEG